MDCRDLICNELKDWLSTTAARFADFESTPTSSAAPTSIGSNADTQQQQHQHQQHQTSGRPPLVPPVAPQHLHSPEAHLGLSRSPSQVSRIRRSSLCSDRPASQLDNGSGDSVAEPDLIDQNLEQAQSRLNNMLARLGRSPVLSSASYTALLARFEEELTQVQLRMRYLEELRSADVFLSGDDDAYLWNAMLAEVAAGLATLPDRLCTMYQAGLLVPGLLLRLRQGCSLLSRGLLFQLCVFRPPQRTVCFCVMLRRRRSCSLDCESCVCVFMCGMHRVSYRSLRMVRGVGWLDPCITRAAG